jgi:hypothetical protein
MSQLVVRVLARPENDTLFNKYPPDIVQWSWTLADSSNVAMTLKKCSGGHSTAIKDREYYDKG